MRLSALVGGLAVLLIGLAAAFVWLFQESTPDQTSRVTAESQPIPENAPVLIAAEAEALREEVAGEPGTRAEPTEAPESYTQALGTVIGRVLEHDLTPATKLPVSVLEVTVTEWLIEPTALFAEESPFPEFESARTVTADDGRFTLRGLEPHSIQILGIDLGGPRSTFRIVDQTPISGDTVDLGDIILEPYVTLFGRVIDEDRKPVAGARVRSVPDEAGIAFQFGAQHVRRGTDVFITPDDVAQIYFEIPERLWQFERLLPIPTTLTNEDGEFRLAGVPVGLASLVADKNGFLAAVKPSQPTGRRPERNVGDLFLTRGARIDGFVQTTAEEPVAGVEVKVGIRAASMPFPISLMQPAGQTGPDGGFSIQGLAPGPRAWVAIRSKPGRPWTTFGPFERFSDPLRIEIDNGREVLVQTTSNSGTELGDVQFYITAKNRLPTLVPLLAPPLTRVREVTAMEGGQYRLADLHDGEYFLVGRAGGFAVSETEIEVGPATGIVELVFEAGYTLDVRVVQGEQEEPVEWAFVCISPADAFEMPADRDRTNADGEVRLDNLRAGEYRITAQHPALAAAVGNVVIPQEEPLILSLAAGGHLKGIVHDSGEPPEAPVFLAVWPHSAEDDWNPTQLPSFTATAESGEFYLPNLAADRYGYQVRDRLVGKGPLALGLTMRDDPLMEGEFDIFEGETTLLEIDLSGALDGPAAALSGSIAVNGQPGRSLTVQWDGPKSKTVETLADGSFDLGWVAAGEGKLKIQDVSGRSIFAFASVLHEEELVLEAGATRHVTLDLSVGSIEGRVTNEYGLAAGTGRFVILSRNGSGSNQVSTANPLTGGFEFAAVTDGEYKLNVYQKGKASHEQTIVFDSRKTPSLWVDVELVDPAQVSGTVILPAGTQLADEEEERRGGLFLWFRDENDDKAGYGSIDRDTLTFTVDSRPGVYSARTRIGGESLVSDPFEVPPGGLSDLALHLQRPDDKRELETLPPIEK